jgi:hypothetical protein
MKANYVLLIYIYKVPFERNSIRSLLFKLQTIVTFLFYEKHGLLCGI